MPSHLWIRYILSSPPSQCSGQRGRMARIIATLMQMIARTPLYCTAALRIAKKPDDRNTERSAKSHNRVTMAARPQNVSRRLRILILARPLCQLFTSPCSDRASFGIDFGQEARSEEHTSELQSLMRISYAVFCLKKKITKQKQLHRQQITT